MSLPLESLTLARFLPLKGSVFVVRFGDGPVDLELVEVLFLGRRREGAQRDPFSLTFRGPVGLRLTQGILALEHEATGILEIFLVQVASTPDGSLFEAIFT